MSEAEKKLRADYLKNRKKWMLIQIIAIAVLAAVVLSMIITYVQVSKTYYINYYEGSNVSYLVGLKQNDFYEDAWIEKDNAYVASLIDSVLAKFEYRLAMDSDKVSYDYSYGIDARLVIADKYTGTPIYSPVYTLLEEKTLTQESGKPLHIKESVSVDYETYNSTAATFTRAYDLDDTKSNLIVTMTVRVNGQCEDAEGESFNEYVASLNIPLNEKTVEMTYSSTIPEAEGRVLACNGKVNKNVFLVLAIVFGSLEVLAVAGFIVFTILTRNHDINYANKVKRIFSNYRSYIQKITNELDTTGYQVLYISTINEMLVLRDTYQLPILMRENADQTATKFMIPTESGILYVHEIRVENYDAIYNKPTSTANTGK